MDKLSKGGGKAKILKIVFDMAPQYFNKIYLVHNNSKYGERALTFVTQIQSGGTTKHSTKKQGGDCPREFILEKHFSPSKTYAQGNGMQYTMYNVNIEYEFSNSKGKFKLECDVAWRIGPELAWQKLNATKDKL